MNHDWMQGAFLVGFSMASEDIWSILAKRRELDITEAMLKDPPKRGDESFEMFRTHGQRREQRKKGREKKPRNDKNDRKKK